MPEYQCKQCGKSVTLPYSLRSDERIYCPYCGQKAIQENEQVTTDPAMLHHAKPNSVQSSNLRTKRFILLFGIALIVIVALGGTLGIMTLSQITMKGNVTYMTTYGRAGGPIPGAIINMSLIVDGRVVNNAITSTDDYGGYAVTMNLPLQYFFKDATINTTIMKEGHLIGHQIIENATVCVYYHDLVGGHWPNEYWESREYRVTPTPTP